ncbi:LPD7 domain-containing protein [Parashewanella tropica]|uniref:LPD7 domain-containing protein n=1 Tax=Parashewanella tropica TaxID=2547970 RepID=UPI00105A13E0|nr:LPD7 domain-containing protein [Parashewanella tropica]
MNDEPVLEQQTYLAIPYEQRDKAIQQLGQLDNGRNAISFDAEKGLWFARKGTRLSKAEPWLPNPNLFNTPTHQDPNLEFAQVLESSGFVLNEPPLFDGQKHRVATIDDKRGQKSGVYCAYGDGHPAGWYQDHRNHSEPQKWHASFAQSDPLAKLHIKAHQANQRSLREITAAKRYQHYANRCSQAFQLMPPANLDHPYLLKKNVQPFPDVMQDKKGRLVIPLMDEHHKVHSLQRITPNGFKCLKKGAQKSGHFFVVGYKPLKDSEPILYAEGYATAASIAEATNRSVVMTVDAGNMPKVAEKLKAHYPNSQHLFLADDDRKNKTNKGLEKARQSAEITQGHWLSPNFISDEIEYGMTDFNDLHVSRGLEVVKRQIENHIQQCWPYIDKPRPVTLNSIEAIVEQSHQQAAPIPANPTLKQQFAPLTKLAKSANDEQVPKEPKPKSAPTPTPSTQNRIPDSLNKTYLAVNNKYYFSNRPSSLAFIDKGTKLQTKLSHAQIVEDLLVIAQQRNWQSVKLSGTKAFKRQAWLQASLQNMTVRGYRPDTNDIKQLKTLQTSKDTKEQPHQPKSTVNEIANTPSNNNPKATLQSAQNYSQNIKPEIQQRFMQKVKQKLDGLLKQSHSQQNHNIIKEPQHEQSLEHQFE